MGQTIAEALREEGKREGMLEGRLKGKLEGGLEADQQRLLLLLRRKFGRKVTAAIVAGVEKTKDRDVLGGWFEKILDATTIEEIGIPAKK